MVANMTQLNIFDGTVYDFLAYKKKVNKKRNRPRFPSYKKVYSTIAYNHDKYRELFQSLIRKAIDDDDPNLYWNTNPYDLLNECYYKYRGIKKYLGDQPHIYRYKTLYKLYELIGEELLKRQGKSNVCLQLSLRLEAIN